jgi:hypothetical protein
MAMRLWTLHPKYLDAGGLVALWREALLAQAVLKGTTSGYTHHPQLVRFRNSPSPAGSIASYLQAVHAEAARRDYHFDAAKIASAGRVESIAVTRGQIHYEWAHLLQKLRVRSPSWFTRLEHLEFLEAHPLFDIVPGRVAEWEVTHLNRVV